MRIQNWIPLLKLEQARRTCSSKRQWPISLSHFGAKKIHASPFERKIGYTRFTLTHYKREMRSYITTEIGFLGGAEEPSWSIESETE